MSWSMNPEGSVEGVRKACELDGGSGLGRTGWLWGESGILLHARLRALRISRLEIQRTSCSGSESFISELGETFRI